MSSQDHVKNIAIVGVSVPRGPDELDVCTG
jgi:hypothetical protein